MKINLTRKQILKLAKQYVYDADDVLGNLMQAAKRRGYMTQDDLIAVARWKWSGGKLRQLCRENTKDEIREISAVAFSAESERLRIGALLSLRGVSWPMASVILHFAFPDRYPILDVRAMNTVGGSTYYNFNRWCEYVSLCRKTAEEFRIDMRALDKALWGFDKATGCARGQ